MKDLKTDFLLKTIAEREYYKFQKETLLKKLSVESREKSIINLNYNRTDLTSNLRFHQTFS